jgi:Tol biopolymer transport system component
MNADATAQVNLTNSPANDSWPRWSPDGTRIIFQSNVSGNFEIWSMDPFGSNRVNLPNNAATDSAPHWSPDGTKIVFHRNVVGSGNDIFVMNADGSNVRRLTMVGSAGADFSSAGPGADRISAEAGERIDIGAGPGYLCVIGGVVGCPARLS